MTPANEAQLLFQISGLDTELRVVNFTAEEKISAPFQVLLSLASEDEIAFDDAIGQSGLLTIRGENIDRYLHGIINVFAQSGSTGRLYLYEAKLVPSAWLLSAEQDCRIFQNNTVEEIVTQILQERGITGDTFVFRLQGESQPREYCVQYRETDLAFISRILEEEGIFYFFEHSEDNHMMVFGNGTVNYQPIAGEGDVAFNPGGNLVPEEESVIRLVMSRQILPGKATLRDYNFQHPSQDLTSENSGEVFQDLEIYDYPGEYGDESTGRRLAQVRLQEMITYREWAEGSSNCHRFVPCFTFNLTGHDFSNFNQEYLITRVYHSGSQPQALEEMAGAGGSSYSNDFSIIPSGVTFRPARKTPKPVIDGVQTAMVVGPSNEEIYTDEHGRVKVQFHWDREGQRDENSSCWIRVSQGWAGAGWGAMYIPRIGQEVIVDFIEGDPDRPIITGRVYHGTNRPPYPLPDEKTKSTIKSDSSIGGGGSNEIRFEDKKGSEEIYIHGQRDMNSVIEHDQSQTVKNNRTTSVSGDDSQTIGNDQTLSVGSNQSLTIGGDQTINVEANQSLTVASEQKENVGANQNLTVGADQTISVGANQSLTVASEQKENVGANQTLQVGGMQKLTVGSSRDVSVGASDNLTVAAAREVKASGPIKISSGAEITLEAGGSTVKIGPAGVTISSGAIITIQGAMIKHNC